MTYPESKDTPQGGTPFIVQNLISSAGQTKSPARAQREKPAKQLRRERFAGTSLAYASNEMLLEEELLMGSWKLRRFPRVKEQEKSIDRTESKKKQRGGRQRSVTPQFAVDRAIRIGEPRMAPRSQDSLRHAHFEVKPILASRPGSVSVAEGRAAYGEGFNQPSISAQIRATNEAAYTEGSKSTDAERVVYVVGTNGQTYEERMRFWQLANDNAHFVGDHKIHVCTTGVEHLWDQATHDPSMPDELRLTVASAKASADGRATLVVNDAGVTKRWLKKRTLSFPPQLREHLTLETPHNSRVAYSVIGQFPHDLSLAGMKKSLDLLVEEFQIRRTPCQAVIHEPTSKNSRKNWHFHLIYYAGEAERQADGRWSFERVEQRDEWRTKRMVPLKRMPRNADITARDWVPRIKQRWCHIVNAQAEVERIATRFTGLSNEKRGLAKAQTRVTQGRMALRKQGHFTDHDIELNIASWEEWEKRQKAKLRNLKAVRAVRDLYETLSGDQRLYRLPEHSQDQIFGQLDKAQEHFKELDAAIEMIAWGTKIRKMVESGPRDVISHYRGVQDQVATKKSTPSRLEKSEFAAGLCREAEAYLLKTQSRLELVQHLQRVADEKVQATLNALREHLPKVERNIDRLVQEATEQAQDTVHREIAPTSTPNLVRPPRVDRNRAMINAHLASGAAMGM